MTKKFKHELNIFILRDKNQSRKKIDFIASSFCDLKKKYLKILSRLKSDKLVEVLCLFKKEHLASRESFEENSGLQKSIWKNTKKGFLFVFGNYWKRQKGFRKL